VRLIYLPANLPTITPFSIYKKNKIQKYIYIFVTKTPPAITPNTVNPSAIKPKNPSIVIPIIEPIHL